MTPNYLIFGYKFLIDLDIPQKIEMKNYLHSKEHRDVVCANVFTSRYMIANNNVIALDYYDISNKRIAMIKITPDICNLKISNNKNEYVPKMSIQLR